jgi:hypothetical protein
MKDLDKLLKNLDDINDEQIKELTKYVKSSLAGKILKSLGYPRVKNVIPELLEMLQDCNWSAANHVDELLVSIGKPVIPFIKEIFNKVKNDDVWHYWILRRVVSNWPVELVIELKPELINLAKKGGLENENLEALWILSRNKILSKKNLINLIKGNREKYLSDKEMLISEQKINNEAKQQINNWNIGLIDSCLTELNEIEEFINNN